MPATGTWNPGYEYFQTTNSTCTSLNNTVFSLNEVLIIKLYARPMFNIQWYAKPCFDHKSKLSQQDDVSVFKIHKELPYNNSSCPPVNTNSKLKNITLFHYNARSVVEITFSVFLANLYVANQIVLCCFDLSTQFRSIHFP